jgi:hypothetical protein
MRPARRQSAGNALRSHGVWVCVVRAGAKGRDGRRAGARSGLGALVAALKLAEQAGVTLVGFLRGSTMNLSRAGRVRTRD